ncbi:Predicted methyltransferase [Parasphingorhabdus marina DSM 22363]|uniref:Predicted methyltransferase n=1 Tax=Parasphingorhabdus marina DSM 22363 TaxID=1123272 RepID=A0A1N6HAM8_9SPHN|nr:methyltransferase [Parasphingorhabdus marina]SIO16842.1 Predicted methyltransferase [Parasphingorhabdus marina DSM 22363]
MRISFFAVTLAAPLLAAASHAQASSVQASSVQAPLVLASQATPELAAAVAAPGRSEGDTKLDDSRKPAELLSFMGLEKGDTVLDIFAGGGYYSEIMGAAVGPDGSVTAVNPPQFVSSEAAKTKWAGIASRQSNVTMVPSQLPDYEAERDSIDFAMLHLIYHDFYWESEQFKFERMDPAVALANLYAGMKPGGIIAVVDHVGRAGDTRAIVEKTHRIDPATVKADFAKAGFVLDAESDMFANPADDLDKNVFAPELRGKTDRFVMRFRKPG